MALLWMDAEGNGISVVETAAEARRKIEAKPYDEQPQLVEFLVDGGDKDNWRMIYVDRDSIYAVEQGTGANSD
jgi:hypothetical protein